MSGTERVLAVGLVLATGAALLVATTLGVLTDAVSEEESTAAARWVQRAEATIVSCEENSPLRCSVLMSAGTSWPFLIRIVCRGDVCSQEGPPGWRRDVERD